MNPPPSAGIGVCPGSSSRGGRTKAGKSWKKLALIPSLTSLLLFLQLPLLIPLLGRARSRRVKVVDAILKPAIGLED